MCADTYSPETYGPGWSVIFGKGNEGLVFRAGVVGGGADDFAVDALLDDVGAPAGGAGDDEERRKHGGGDLHDVVADGGEPVEVGEHFFGFPHDGFEPLGDVIKTHAAGFFRELFARLP